MVALRLQDVDDRMRGADVTRALVDLREFGMVEQFGVVYAITAKGRRTLEAMQR